MTANQTYFVSSTAGSLELDSDLSSNDYISPAILAVTTTVGYVIGKATGQQVA